MKRKVFEIAAFVALFLMVACQPKTETKTDVKTDNMVTPSAKLDPVIEKRIDSLMALLSLEEKVGQLNQLTSRGELTGNLSENAGSQQIADLIKQGMVGSMLNVVSVNETRAVQKLAVETSPHGIPLVFAYDVIHGYKTMFPIPLGEAASWDLEAARLSASIAAKEAAAAGLHWTFAPMMDISRDARWGRSMEGAGEDVYLGTKFAVARVQGFQGDNLADVTTVAACAKHFAAYGYIEAGKEYNTVDISEHTLRNVVLPPFKACVEAGVATFMNSFNEIGGVPSTGNSYLQRDILKGEWGFDGLMVSDWASIAEMITHGVAANEEAAALLAITAGSDMDMEGYCYVPSLVKLVKEGKVNINLIDDAVRRVLRLKFRLGLFDDPYKYCDNEREKANTLTAEHLEAARDIARKSIVLLKNEGNLLPIKENVKTIAVIGGLAADKDVPIGSWRAQGETNSAVSLLEGLQAASADKFKIEYAEGYKITNEARHFVSQLKINTTDRSGFAAAVATAKRADVVVLVVGEDCFQSGEGRSQTNIQLVGLQQELIDAVTAANPNVIMVLMNGRPLDISKPSTQVKSILEVWHLGSQAGNAIADVIFGKYNPSGKLPMTFPRNVGQCPIYYSYKNTGRPVEKAPEQVFWTHYTDAPNTPLYPFGFGLSYTTFTYSDIKLSETEITPSDKLMVSVTVTNSGAVKGTEIVQLYIRDLVGSVTRPVKELKGFSKIELEAGASKEVSFELSATDLAFYGADMKFKAEAGDFKVFVGGNSVDVKESAFKLK